MYTIKIHSCQGFLSVTSPHISSDISTKEIFRMIANGTQFKLASVTHPPFYLADNGFTVHINEAVDIEIVNHGDKTYMMMSNKPDMYLCFDLVANKPKFIQCPYSFANSLSIDDVIVNGFNLTFHAKEVISKGYTILKNVLTKEEVETIKVALDISKRDDQEVLQIRRGDLLERHEMLGKILTNNTLLALITIIMFDDFKLATWSSNTLFKSGPQSKSEMDAGWHVDYPYHDIAPPWPKTTVTSPFSVQTLWLMDDFTIDNGATWMVPESHKLQVPPSYSHMASCTPMQLCASQGDVVVTHGAWWHCQGVNMTEYPRTCLLGTFTKRWIRSKDNMEEQFKMYSSKYGDNDILKHLISK